MPLAIERLQQEVLQLPWRIVLSEPLVLVDSATDPPHRAVLAAIPLLGTWSGWLILSADVRIAHEIATRVRGDEPVRPADLDEAACWLVTGIAQAMHLVLDPRAVLGAAAMLDGASPWLPASCREAGRLCLQSGDRQLSITLHERVPLSVRRTDSYPSDLEAAPSASDVDPQAAELETASDG